MSLGLRSCSQSRAFSKGDDLPWQPIDVRTRHESVAASVTSLLREVNCVRGSGEIRQELLTALGRSYLPHSPSKSDRQLADDLGH